MAEERDELVKKMQKLIEESRQLAADHLKVVEEFQRVSKQIEELDRRQGRYRLP